MRIFLAGATGVLGARLTPLMTAKGFEVAAMTRTASRMEGLRELGVTAVLCDVFDAEALAAAVCDFRPDIVMHQVTDLPDAIAEVPKSFQANARVRSEGTQNLLAAARAAGASRFIAQSIAWPGGPVVEAHERAVLSADGVVLRYGQFYGPGTYYECDRPPLPRIHIDHAASRTMLYLSSAPGVYEIVEAEEERHEPA